VNSDERVRQAPQDVFYETKLRRITALKPEKLAAVEKAIRFALGFSA
jgi:hypothetical protein